MTVAVTVSRLSMPLIHAEIELSVLSRQCLSRRLGEQAVLRREVEAWVERLGASAASVDWRFTTEDARIKLKRLYPKFDD